uniref:Uncharacterized protein n=1 Tax=Panagrolaimus sp. JU765 TaxID=591449 RepID=A0AC34PYW8_9BILA
MALMDISSTVCLTSPHVIEDDTMFGFGITALIAINLLGIITASIVMFLETYFKAQYHGVKNKPVKLVLTRDFLEKLRPKKKMMTVTTNAPDPNAMSCPELASVPREQMSVPNEAPEKVAEKTPNEQSKTLLKTISDKAKNPGQKSEKKHKEKEKEKEKEESIEKQPEKPEIKNSKDGKGSKDSKDSKKEGKDSKETKDAKKGAK